LTTLSVIVKSGSIRWKGTLFEPLRQQPKESTSEKPSYAATKRRGNTFFGTRSQEKRRISPAKRSELA
jgi:hypothetical protein